MAITLRGYQLTAADSIMREFEKVDSTLLVLPTGAGKTVIFSEIIRRFQPKRAMVLAHREELITQAREKIMSVTGLECDVEMADNIVREEFWGRKPVVVSTIQTQIAGCKGKGRMTRFKPDDFDLLVIDEGHHATADSYKRVIAYYRQNPRLKVLGVTATPDRSDEAALGEIFQTVAFDYEIVDAINDGYLVPIDQRMVHVHSLDFSKVRTTTKGDLNGSQLAEVMEREENMQKVASASLEIISDRSTIIFTASVKQAEMLSEIFNRHRSGMAGWVSGETPSEDRKNLLASFSSGKTQVVANCGVLTEGFDSPSVAVVVMARPTKSRALYAQMVGRGTRPLPGVIDRFDTPEARKAEIEFSEKSALMVVDFTGNAGKHKLCSTADILGGKSTKEVIEEAKARLAKSGSKMRMVDVIAEIEDERQRAEEIREQQRQAEISRRAALVAKATFSQTAVSPFNKFQVCFQAASPWDRQNRKQLSDKQRAIIKSVGVNPDEISVSCQKQLVASVMSKPSEKMEYHLKKRGLWKDGMTRAQAKTSMDQVAIKEGWTKRAS